MMQAAQPSLILASGSTTRQALMTAAGLRFEIRVAPIDEAEAKRAARAEGLDADEAALMLAELKAMRVARSNPDALVIGCDQILVCDGVWFDKPTDRDSARAQLQTLRGRAHTLETAIICLRGSQRVWHHIAHPCLTMRNFSDAFLESYLDAEGDAVTASVGGYRLEGLGQHLFDRIEGEHAAILGVPMLALLSFLRQHHILVVQT